MKTKHIILLIAYMALASTSVRGQGAAFTYQGLLVENGTNFNGTVELDIGLWDQATNGTRILPPRPETKFVEVSNGVFTVSLDFGKGAFATGAQRWLQIDLRTSPDPAPFTTLWPRQKITATPYAMTAEHLTGLVPSDGLFGGYFGAVTFDNTNNVFIGQGDRLLNLDASQLTSGTVPMEALANAWQIGGNAGTTPGTHFLGTTDDQPLELKVNGVRTLRLEPAEGFPNLIGGSPSNQIAANVQTAVIAGGYLNTIRAPGGASAILGGDQNSVLSNGFYGVILGGRLNTAGRFALAAGHQANAEHTGSFVWADSVNAPFASTATNEFAVRAGGGARFVTGGAGMTVDGQVVLSGVIGQAQLGNSSVTQTKLAPDAVTSIAIADGSIAPADLNASLFSTAFWKADGNAGTTAGTHFLGTTDNQALEFKVGGLRALRLEPTGDSTNDFDTLPDGAPNVIGGAPNNSVAPGVVGATIAGGGATNVSDIPSPNIIGGDYSNIGGGRRNTIQFLANHCTIGGGFYNTIETNALSSVIGGGTENTIEVGVDRGTISGGYLNRIEFGASSSTIAGGVLNRIQLDADWSAIAGGSGNVIQRQAAFNTIAGGGNNTIETHADSCAVGGGGSNLIQSNASGGVIAGGGQNKIQTNAVYGVISGGRLNTIQSGALSANIGGGTGNTIQTNARWVAIGGGATNTISPGADWSVVAGGRNNAIQTNAEYGIISGGQQNAIQLNADWSTIGGGDLNTIQSNGFYNAILGGRLNTIQVGADAGAIGGGRGNTIQRDGQYHFIGGGDGNTIQAGGQANAIGGGFANSIHISSGSCAIAGGNGCVAQSNVVAGSIGGGVQNTIQTNAFACAIAGGSANRIQFDADRSTIGGGYLNQVRQGAEFATIPGGRENAATNYAFAAGRRAHANHQGAFVWGDSTDVNLLSTNDNSVTMRAAGGYRLFSNSGANLGVYLAPGGGGWVAISDRNAKENVKPVNGRAILEKVASLPLSTWNYKSQTNGVRHIGPMAQDFKAAFAVGETDTGINTVDADGVALAAIQGLNEKIQQKETEITELKAQNQSLEQRLDALEKIVRHQKSN